MDLSPLLFELNKCKIVKVHQGNTETRGFELESRGQPEPKYKGNIFEILIYCRKDKSNRKKLMRFGF